MIAIFTQGYRYLYRRKNCLIQNGGQKKDNDECQQQNYYYY